MTKLEYRFWHLVVVLSFVVLCFWVFCGCAPIEGSPGRGGGTTANPGAFAELNMATGKVVFSSNRDDDGSIEGLNITVPKDIKSPVAGATVSLEKMDFKANASDVRDSNAGQIRGMGEFNEATGRAWSGIVESVGVAASSIIGRVIPQTGAWAMKLLVMAVGIPIAAVFACIIGVLGFIVICVVLLLGYVAITRIKTKVLPKK